MRAFRAQYLFWMFLVSLTLMSCVHSSATPKSPLISSDVSARDTVASVDEPRFSQSLDRLKKPEVLYRERLSYAELLLKHLKNNASQEIVEQPTYIKSVQQVADAKLAHERHELGKALLALDDAIVALETLSTQRPIQQRQQRRYHSLKEGLPYFYAAYQRNVQRELKEGKTREGAGYSRARVDILLTESEQLAEHGRFGEAAVLLDEAQSLIAEAIRDMLNYQKLGTVTYVVEEDRSHLGKSQQQRDEEAYQSVQDGIEVFLGAAKRVAKQDHALFDGELVAWLQAEANKFALQHRYSEAEAVLRQIRNLVTRGLKERLDGESIVVRIDVSTPDLEYRYEYNRFLGYEELIPVAIKQMRPEEDVLELIHQYVDQARWMAEQAENKRKLEALSVAIRMIQDATAVIQLALKTAGVPIYNPVSHE